MKVQHKNNNNNNNNRVPGAAGGSGKLDSSNQPRHTQGREKSRPNNKMLWERIGKLKTWKLKTKSKTYIAHENGNV